MSYAEEVDFAQLVKIYGAAPEGLWSVEEIAALLPVEAPKKRGPYKKRAAAGNARISN